MKFTRIILLSFSMICLSNINSEAQNRFDNTLFYTDSTRSPAATLDALSWIEGLWKGEAFGGITEEIWTAPSGGSMMCAFKLMVNNKVKFYEMVTLIEENNTLLLRLKHFHPDLRGWGRRKTEP